MILGASPPRLPAELTDIALDFLYDDEESLVNCSLVCKDWLPTARYHLFRELFLHQWNLEAFLDLVTHPLSTIMPYIVSLTIDQVNRHIHLFDDMFPRLRRPFRFLRKLELRNIHWCDYEAVSVDTLISACNSATDLTLHQLVFDNTTDLWSVIARFPALERLSVTETDILNQLPRFVPDLDVADFFPHFRPPNIHELDITEGSFYQTHILNWFFSHGTFVNSLSVSPPDFSILNQHLQILGPSLLFLQVDVVFSPAVFLSELNLSFSTHLQKLRLCNFTFESNCSPSSMLPAMFATATSSCIYEIEFAFSLSEDIRLYSEHENYIISTTPGSSMWSILDTVLFRFTSLRTVRFTLSPDQPDPLSLISYLKRNLPLCDARGVLSFEHANDEGDISSPHVRLDSWNGMVSGPFCIAQMQDSST